MDILFELGMKSINHWDVPLPADVRPQLAQEVRMVGVNYIQVQILYKAGQAGIEGDSKRILVFRKKVYRP